MNEKLKQIADHYGIRPQLEQLIEESAELIVAIRKFLRKPSILTIAGLADEIADVEVMLEQVKCLVKIEDEVEEIKAAKIERTLKRIEQEKEKNG